MVAVADPTLAARIRDGARVSTEEALELYRWPLEELGALADARRVWAKRPAYDERGAEIVT